MTRYKIYYKASKIPKSRGTGGAGTGQRFVDYERKSYSSRGKAQAALKRYVAQYKQRDYRSVGAKFELRSVAQKKRTSNLFGSNFRL